MKWSFVFVLAGSVVAATVSASGAPRDPGWFLVEPVEDPDKPPRRSETPFVTRAMLDAIRADACVAHAGTLRLQGMRLSGPTGGFEDLTVAAVSPGLIPVLADGLPGDAGAMDRDVLVLLPRGRDALRLGERTGPMTLTRSVAIVQMPDAPVGAPPTIETPVDAVAAEAMRPLPDALGHVSALRADRGIETAPSLFPVRLLIALADQGAACRAKVDAWSGKLGAHQVGQAYRVRDPHEDG
jgi:hypothetical protein